MSDERFAARVKTLIQNDASTMDVGALLRRHWKKWRTQIPEAEKSGYVAAGRLSDVMDEIITSLEVMMDLGQCTVVATGGYGRGRLAPYSDVDLLFLADADQEEAVRKILYPLWDGSIPVSYAVNTVDGAIHEAQSDIIARTALLDARFLWGDKRVFDDLQAAFEGLKSRARWEFIAAKFRERDERHIKNDASPYAIEPDVKEGVGGLRDLDTFHWVEKILDGVDGENPLSSLTPRERARAEKVREFLWTTRAALHVTKGRPDEVINFGIQPQLARRLGYRGEGDADVVERFMRHYFLYTRQAVRLLEGVQNLIEDFQFRSEHPAPNGSEIPGYEKEAWAENISVTGRQLTFRDHDRVAEQIYDIMALFRVSAESDRSIHLAALRTITQSLHGVLPTLLDHPNLIAEFRIILRAAQKPARVVRDMAKTGLLGRLVPAFGNTIGKVEYGLFRRFTVDEHVLRSIDVFQSMLTGKGDSDYVLTGPMARQLDDHLAILVALLLQEAPVSTREEREEVLREALRLVGCDDGAEQVAFLVSGRDLLLRAVVRRNVADIVLVRTLSRRIETETTLSHLAVLTTCRNRTAGVDSWEQYARRDVRLLIDLLQSYIRGGQAASEEVLSKRHDQLTVQALALLSDDEADQFRAFVQRTGPSLWSVADVSAAADLALLAHATDVAGETGRAVIQEVAGGMLRVIMYTERTPGLFSKCAGVVTSLGGSVWSASGFPLSVEAGELPRAGLIFQFQRASLPPGPFSLDADELAYFEKRFEDVARHHDVPIQLPSRPIGDRRSVFSVDPTIRVDNSASGESLIVEVETLDQPGLLHHLAEEIAGIGVSIQFAFVATYGHRAVDTFYLQDSPGYKIENPRRIETIKRHLLRVLQQLRDEE